MMNVLHGLGYLDIWSLVGGIIGGGWAGGVGFIESKSLEAGFEFKGPHHFQFAFSALCLRLRM